MGWLWHRLIICAALAVAFILTGARNSAALEVSRTTLAVPGLPPALEGLRIVQITDLHSSQYGAGQEELLAPIAAFRPDLIVLTGDILDGYRPLPEPCEELARGLARIAPVYRVRGNHEYYQGFEAARQFDALMARCGVMLLDNSSVVLERNGCRYLLSGIDDVQRRTGNLLSRWHAEQVDYETAEEFEGQIRANLPAGDFPLKIMLSHRPFCWSLFQADDYDVAFCGHLHGLQVRVPGLGGVPLHPSRYFPQADSGLYELDGLQLYLSRGLDRRSALGGLRINNRPELAFFTVTAR